MRIQPIVNTVSRKFCKNVNKTSKPIFKAVEKETTNIIRKTADIVKETAFAQMIKSIKHVIKIYKGKGTLKEKNELIFKKFIKKFLEV